MTVPPEFWQGVAQFNRGEFYTCHDTLEALWHEAVGPHKDFYQGILQVAVGCYHLGNDNWRGAAVLLGAGASRLESYEPSYEGVDVVGLRDRALDLLAALHQAGMETGEPAALTNLEALLPRIERLPAEGSEEES
ncbi:MAG: DUF309 domain-containing protein [Cyanobacteria bacterium J06641_5]